MAKIGLIQMDNSMNPDVEARQDAMVSLAERCLDEGADLVLFPECFQYAKCDRRHKPPLVEAYAERLRGLCSELARRYHAYVVPWDYYVAEDGKTYNSSYIIDRNGDTVGRYRKCNLTYAELSTETTCGCELPVFDLDFGKVGIMICFDNYFPEVAATLGNKGAELILYPLYGDTLNPQWEIKLRARAMDHSLYIAPCQIDSQQKVSFTGMVDPEGNIIAKLEKDNTYCVVDIEMGKKVFTNTAASKTSKGENLREYLHKCRNYPAFSELSEEGTSTADWKKIFLD